VNPNAKTCGPGRKCQDDAFEEEIKAWILEQRSNDLPVRPKDVINRVIAVRPSFCGGKRKQLTRWVYKFLARKGFSLRRATRIGQKLTGHLMEV